MQGNCTLWYMGKSTQSKSLYEVMHMMIKIPQGRGGNLPLSAT